MNSRTSIQYSRKAVLLRQCKVLLLLLDRVTLLRQCKLVLVLSIITCFGACHCDNFQFVQREYRLQYNRINRDIDDTIIFSAFLETSFLRCTTKCSQIWSASVYFLESENTCFCNNALDLRTDYDASKPQIVYGFYKHHLEISRDNNFTKRNVWPRKSDCLDLYNAGYIEDGVYTIYPPGQDAVDTRCDMQNGGWTVFQLRQDGSEDFFRGWKDYVEGFGNGTGEYWLGLENLHTLTVQESELFVYLESFGDIVPGSANETYALFRIDDATTKYRINAAGYSGTCNGDVFGSFGNGRSFSTYDSDNDVSAGNCATELEGAWWYDRCHRSNLNGLYLGGYHYGSYANGMNWKPCWGYHYSAKISVMKVRRN